METSFKILKEKQQYQNPIAEIIEIDNQDILTTSSEDNWGEWDIEEESK